MVNSVQLLNQISLSLGYDIPPDKVNELVLLQAIAAGVGNISNGGSSQSSENELLSAIGGTINIGIRLVGTSNGSRFGLSGGNLLTLVDGTIQNIQIPATTTVLYNGLLKDGTITATDREFWNFGSYELNGTSQAVSNVNNAVIQNVYIDTSGQIWVQAAQFQYYSITVAFERALTEAYIAYNPPNSILIGIVIARANTVNTDQIGYCRFIPASPIGFLPGHV